MLRLGFRSSSMPYDLTVLTESLEDRLVDTLPNTCLHPFLRAMSARHASAAAKPMQ